MKRGLALRGRIKIESKSISNGNNDERRTESRQKKILERCSLGAAINLLLALLLL